MSNVCSTIILYLFVRKVFNINSAYIQQNKQFPSAWTAWKKQGEIKKYKESY